MIPSPQANNRYLTYSLLAGRPPQPSSHLSSEFAARCIYHPAAQPAAHPFAPSCSSGLDRKIIAIPVAPSPRQRRRRAETSIAFLAAPLSRGTQAHYLSTRFRALALFGRRSPERVVRSPLPAAENLVWGARCQERFSFFFISSSFSNSFVRPGRSHSSAPAARSKGRRAQQRSRMGPVFGTHRVSGAQRPVCRTCPTAWG